MSHQSVADALLMEMDVGESAPADERRKNPRKRTSAIVEALVSLRNTPVWIQVTVHDISVSGIGMTTNRVFYVGEHLIMRLAFPGRTAKHILCQVKNCAYLGRGLHRIGIECCAAHEAPRQIAFIPPDWKEIIGESASSTRS